MHRFDLSKYSASLYGGIKYGEQNLVQGEFKTKEFAFGSPILGSFAVEFKADFNNLNLEYDAEELVYTGTWIDGTTYMYSNTINDTCTGYFTGTGFQLNYVANAGNTSALSVKINYLDDTETPDETLIVVDQTTGSSATIDIGLSIRPCTFEIKKTAAGTARISSIDVNCTELRINTYVSYDGETWETPFYLDYALVSPGIYRGTTSEFSGNYPVKTKLDIEMLSGSFYSNIEIYYINIYSENLGYTVETGTWSKVYDLGGAPLSFGNITWTSQIPEGCTINIQTKTSNSTDFSSSEISSVYEQNRKNLRLTDGQITGTFLTTSIQPQQINEFCEYYYIYFTPEDHYIDGTTWIKYYIVKQNLDEIEITDQTNFSLLDIDNVSIKLKIEMGRLNSSKMSPQYVSGDLGINVIYEEVVAVAPILTDMANVCRLFADDINDSETNQGTRKVLEISNMGFSTPASISNETYSITDRSYHKNYIKLFWYDHPDDATTGRTDKLYATALTSSIVCRYYGSGIVYFSQPLAFEISNSFYPMIPSTAYDFAYRLVNGWKQERDGVISIYNTNSEILMGWSIIDLVSGPGENYDPMITEKSKRNNYEYPESEPINDSVAIESQKGIVTKNIPWVSKKDEYQNVFVNPNYTVIQQNYTSTLTLPVIPSVVQVGSNPYKMEIMPNTVSMNGDYVSSDRLISTFTPSLTETTINNEIITRGMNYIDYLSKSMITTIDKISDTYGGVNDYIMLTYKNKLGVFGNFETATDGLGDGWTKDNANAVCSILNNEQTIITPETEDTTISLTFGTTIGSKYYFSSQIQNCTIEIEGETYTFLEDEYIYFDLVFEATATDATISVTINGDQESLEAKIKKLIVIDLTELFTTGLERDLSWCRNNIPYTTASTTNIATANWIKVGNGIEWISGAPTYNSKYYVTYDYMAPDSASLTVSCDYSQVVKDTAIWESSVILKNYYDSAEHETAVTCSPGIPFTATLPDIETTWTIPANVTNLTFKIYDNNALVQTYISDNTLIGTLNENIPSRNWHPIIGEGFYYKKKDEFYVYNEVDTFEIVSDSIDPVLKTLSLSVVPGSTSPIIVEIPNIETRQVGFTDAEGNYVTYLTEIVTLDGTPRVKLSYTNIDSAFTITAITEDEETIDIIDVLTTDNVVSLAINDGGSIRALTEIEAREYKGTKLYITYQPKDCYVIEHQEDSIKITFSEVYTEGIIYYESSSEISNQIENIDMNPLVGLRDKGFLYIETDEELINPNTKRYISIDAHPKNIKAGETSTINISVYDQFLNPVSESITVVSSDGTTLQNVAGTPEGIYIYRYINPTAEVGTVKISVTNGTIVSEVNIEIY